MSGVFAEHDSAAEGIQQPDFLIDHYQPKLFL